MRISVTPELTLSFPGASIMTNHKPIYENKKEKNMFILSAVMIFGVGFALGYEFSVHRKEKNDRLWNRN